MRIPLSVLIITAVKYIYREFKGSRRQFDNQAKINRIVFWFVENQFEIKIF